MTRMSRAAYCGLVLSCVLASALTVAAQVDSNLYVGLKWRNVGPFHGGRIGSVTGVIGQPGVFYAGMPAGGIWKTTSAGVTWFPIFDRETSVDSIGAIQVAPSNPDIIYAGAGDPILGSLGNGMWKSTDAGATWQHIGLEDTVKIDSIVVDPAILTWCSLLPSAMLPATAAACTAPPTAARAGPTSSNPLAMTAPATWSTNLTTPALCWLPCKAAAATAELRPRARSG